jgi:membrane protease subunit (stomatin/prohibitin family)
VLGWYLTGRHITGKQMRELYGVAFARGKRLAQDLVSKVPKPRLGRRKEPALLPETVQAAAQRAEQTAAAQAAETQVVDVPAAQICPNCGRASALDASFCQYCGQKLLTAG